MNTNTATKAIQYVQASSVLAKRALDSLATKEAADKAADAKIAALVDHMITTNVLKSENKQAAEQALTSRTGTMDLLKLAVDLVVKVKSQQKTASDHLGGPSGEPNDETPAYDSLSSPFVGARTSEKKASDDAFVRGLGVTLPSR